MKGSLSEKRKKTSQRADQRLSPAADRTLAPAPISKKTYAYKSVVLNYLRRARANHVARAALMQI